MLIILVIGILAAIAVGVLGYSIDPFAATAGVKALFLASVLILIISASALVLYGIAVAWHNGMKYYLATYFGSEQPYFKSSFSLALAIGFIGLGLILLRRFGIFNSKI